MSSLRLILLDIEGTTLPISFVQKVLFPYAERTLPTLLREQADSPAVRVALGDIEREFPGRDPLAQLQDWMAHDVKAAPLKTLQGLAWRSGFESGELRADLYPDVSPALKAWHDSGLRLAVYSSGSADAQRLLYGYSSNGDLTPLFEAFYDLDIGGKKVAESYTEIASRAGLAPQEILFLSDVGAELDAAQEAGCATCQLIRPEDGTKPAPGFRHAADLLEVATQFGLPISS
ncbi:acireductone synthase [Kozakia baliensis]|uniref:Enolase-phosphatase E1 n=1 Tax=Kozakia baliensis TaxID=153496 RepID=A0A1D8UVL6_9PROT|nr:acireductone synthase [Kozakia baliensis]AOX17696.1 2,3-diketo-5-methylthio-1-phosphopentane phosphatase [Kozakia baliensis]GBR31563.1 2,3-diketo-5-methylthio-1-phosphopentane phosphatase [Kozakia baliensis NRIC 0488]GEL62795.1 enolase-phosphatase E1 [Kozakia baliensis]